MALPDPKLVYLRMIDALAEAAACSRQLAFLREQNEWLIVDEKLLHMRNLIINLAEGKEKQNLSKGIIIQ